MKKAVILALALLLILSFASCGGGGASSEPESSVPASSATETDLSSEISEKATAFANAIKANNVVMMETLGNAPVDTYGDWAQPEISAVSVSTVSLGKTVGVFTLEINVANANGVNIVSDGVNVFTLTIEWNDDDLEYIFTFVKS